MLLVVGEGMRGWDYVPSVSLSTCLHRGGGGRGRRRRRELSILTISCTRSNSCHS